MVTNDIATLSGHSGFRISLGSNFEEIDAEWLESNAARLVDVQSRDVFVDGFQLDRNYIDEGAENAICGMASYGKTQFNDEPTREESL